MSIFDSNYRLCCTENLFIRRTKDSNVVRGKRYWIKCGSNIVLYNNLYRNIFNCVNACGYYIKTLKVFEITVPQAMLRYCLITHLKRDERSANF